MFKSLRRNLRTNGGTREKARAVGSVENICEQNFSSPNVPKVGHNFTMSLADRHKQQVGGEKGDASSLQTALSKGFGCGLASKLRSEGSPFDVSYSYLLLFVSIVASSLRFGFFGLLFWLGSLWCGKPCSALELPSNIAARWS